MSDTSRRPTVVPGPFRDPGDLLTMIDELRLAIEAGTITEVAIAGVGPDGATWLQHGSGRPLAHPMALAGAVAALERETHELMQSGVGW